MGFEEATGGRYVDTTSSNKCSWLEYQAKYFAAALLMPREIFTAEFCRIAEEVICGYPIFDGQPQVGNIVSVLARAFGVSPEAATYRARDLECLVPDVGQLSLFP